VDRVFTTGGDKRHLLELTDNTLALR